MKPVVRAVDIGFGQTKYVTGVIHADIRCASFPSVCYPTARDSSTVSAIERRATVCVPINGLFYEVGPEIVLAGDGFRPSQMHDRYTETPEYLALVHGALRMMKVPTIDLLVVGFPARSNGSRRIRAAWRSGVNWRAVARILAWRGRSTLSPSTASNPMWTMLGRPSGELGVRFRQLLAYVARLAVQRILAQALPVQDNGRIALIDVARIVARSGPQQGPVVGVANVATREQFQDPVAAAQHQVRGQHLQQRPQIQRSDTASRCGVSPCQRLLARRQPLEDFGREVVLRECLELHLEADLAQGVVFTARQM
ncbi:MAG: hypothetical protein QM740_20440 [Acidovorax sp.]